MNNQGFLILALLCGLAACMSFRWVKTDFNYMGKTITHMTYQSTSDGTMYVAYEDKLNGLNRTVWEAISKEGSITIKSGVDEKDVTRGFVGMVTQISDDAKHLLAAFFGCYNERLLHDLESSVKDCASVYFIESVDGGVRWSTPVRVSESGVYIPPKSSISLILEKDTGTVYLFHEIKASPSVYNSQIVLYIREPTEKVFKHMNTFLNVRNLGPFTALTTKGRSDGRRYLHLIMAIDGGMVYYRSDDKGGTWSTYRQIVQGITPYYSNYVVYDLEYDAEYFEFIYRTENDRKVYTIWTDNHGNTFRSPTLVGDSPRPNQERIGLCRSPNARDSVVLVSQIDPDPKNIFVKARINSYTFVDLPNPFGSVRGAPVVNLMIGCASKGGREYYITFYMSAKAETERMYVAFGILNLN